MTERHTMSDEEVGTGAEYIAMVATPMPAYGSSIFLTLEVEQY